MRILGGGKKPKKLTRKQQLKDAFDIQLNPTARDKAAAAKEALIRKLAGEKKKEAARQAMVDKADALKAAALERREAEQQRQLRASRQRNQRENTEQRTACTCRKPTLKGGKCTRCRKKPAAPTRRRGRLG